MAIHLGEGIYYDEDKAFDEQTTEVQSMYYELVLRRGVVDYEVQGAYRRPVKFTYEGEDFIAEMFWEYVFPIDHPASGALINEIKTIRRKSV